MNLGRRGAAVWLVWVREDRTPWPALPGAPWRSLTLPRLARSVRADERAHFLHWLGFALINVCALFPGSGMSARPGEFQVVVD